MRPLPERYDLDGMLDGKGPALVAIIEDDAASRHALGRLLVAAGFEPSLFDSAETFIASESDCAWLCLIVDVQLAGISGIDLQQKLRLQGSDVPIIITTGNRADIIRERAQLAGCSAFLWKPFSSDTLLGLLGSISRQTQT